MVQVHQEQAVRKENAKPLPTKIYQFLSKRHSSTIWPLQESLQFRVPLHGQEQ